MDWIVLVVAGLFETAFAFCLGKAKESAGNERWLWYAGFAAALMVSMTLLVKAIQTLPVGTAYAVWTGIGAAGTVLIGIFVFREPVAFWRMFFVSTLIISVVGLKAVSHGRDTTVGEVQEKVPNKITSIALLFNECINGRNADGLADLMTEDHLFVDAANNATTGKSRNMENWRSFFDLFPDYRNVLEVVRHEDSTVIMRGYSVCADKRLNEFRAIWVARIENEKVKEWRVYADTEENRRRAGITNT